MFAEHANAMISHASSQDSRKHWQKQSKGGFQQWPPMHVKTNRETNAQGTTGLEPMELGIARRRKLAKEEYQKLRVENACFYCRRPNAGHLARDCPLKKKRQGNGGTH